MRAPSLAQDMFLPPPAFCSGAHDDELGMQDRGPLDPFNRGLVRSADNCWLQYELEAETERTGGMRGRMLWPGAGTMVRQALLVWLPVPLLLLVSAGAADRDRTPRASAGLCLYGQDWAWFSSALVCRTTAAPHAFQPKPKSSLVQKLTSL